MRLKVQGSNVKATKSGESPPLLHSGERKTGELALTDHSRVHDHRATKRAAPGGRLGGGASTATSVAHLRPPYHPSYAA